MTAPAVSRGTTPGLAAAVFAVATLDDILLELVDVDDNVRVDVGDLAELMASIAELGVIQPIKVTAQPTGRYRVVWGQRRVLACRELGRKRIPAVVEPPSDVDEHGARRSIEQLSENLQRKDLNAIEEAVALREVLDADPDLTITALADKLGMSRSWASNTLRLLETDPVVQEGVRAGSITASHAKSMVVLPPKEQRSIAERIVAGNLPAHRLEEELRWKLQEVSNREATAKRTEKAIPKVLALLKAEVPKDTEIYLQGAYNLETDAIKAAVRKAGWPELKRGYAWDRPAKGKCDCKVVRVEFNRSWKVTPACAEDRHRDRQVNADHVAEREREKRIVEKVADLQLRIAAALETTPIHPGVELLLTANSYHELAKRVDTDPAAIRMIVAHRLAQVANPRYAWGDDRGPAEQRFDQVVAMFEPVVAAEAPVKPKRRKAAE